jgi:hypothetical protein
MTRRASLGSRWRNNLAVLSAVLIRPRLWRAALTAYVRMLPTRWWRNRPFLPLPPADYLRFRKEAYYGSETALFDPKDVLKYLQWIRSWDRGAPGDG